MKKNATANKKSLAFRTETVRPLSPAEMNNIAGGFISCPDTDPSSIIKTSGTERC